MIFVDADAETKLVINSLYGTMDEVDLNTYSILSSWRALENITPVNDTEQTLYNILQQRGYLIENDAEEMAIKNGILESLRDFHAEEKGKYRGLTIIMTYDCNFKCPYCFEGETNKRKNVMTSEMIDAALNITGDDLEAILLFGGEPLLPQTRPMVEYLFEKKAGISYNIITNGYYLEEFADLLTTVNVGCIFVTLDGDEETHNRRRCLANGEPTYQKILSGVRVCLENKIPIKIRSNVKEGKTELGLDVQNKLAERFKAYGDLLSFQTTTMMGYTDKQKNDVITEMFGAVLQYDKHERMQKNSALGAMNPIVSALSVGKRVQPLYSFCYAHENKIAVDPYGNIYTCLVTVGKNGMEAGIYYPEIQYKENSIKNRNIDKIPECRECIYSLLCGGGCPIRLRDYSDYFRPVCTSIRNQIHHLLPKLYLAEKAHRQKVTA
ncbi:MAG: radical SAM protein [Defluviitaleaceae bacterium]|nr:radical SAM protein [Defluviitaleaceae bacterium]